MSNDTNESLDIGSSIKIPAEKVPSFITRVSAWLANMLSWQGALATSFGLLCGVLLSTQWGAPNSNDSNLSVVETLTIHAPIWSPQKANIDYTRNLFPQFKCIEVPSNDLKGVCVSLTPDVQHWFYTDKQGGLKAIPAPALADSVLELWVDKGDIAVEVLSEKSRKQWHLQFKIEPESHSGLLQLK
jgi:hypothetical protein